MGSKKGSNAARSEWLGPGIGHVTHTMAQGSAGQDGNSLVSEPGKSGRAAGEPGHELKRSCVSSCVRHESRLANRWEIRFWPH